MSADSNRRSPRRPAAGKVSSSKWQALPTEAINPASMGIDKASTADIVDLMVAEDRRIVSAVHRERARIAVVLDQFEELFTTGDQEDQAVREQSVGVLPDRQCWAN